MSEKIEGLNADQQKASNGFFDFLLNPDEKEMIISGPGGVGKTYLMGHLIDNVIPMYSNICKMMNDEQIYREVNMTATTNKASAVLGEATKRPTETIQSFMNLVVKEDYATGRTSLRPSRGWTVHENQILFIDEYTFIDSQLLNFINDGTSNCKIVYVGDHCQLAPVMEKVSPITKKNIPIFELTQQMRTSDADLMALNNQLRQTVLTGEFKPIQIVPGTIDWLDGPTMQSNIDRDFIKPTRDNRILAYTNKQVVDYNAYVRELRNQTEPYVVGTTLVCNSGVKIANNTINAEQEVYITYVDPNHEIMDFGDCHLTVQRIKFESLYGVDYPGVNVPVDQQHYLNVLKYLANQKRWTEYFQLKNLPDLRQRDASTIYKAQGSTYETVYIDAEDISKCSRPDEVARMLYVAVSRAKKRVCFYGELAPKYGGLVL